MEKRRVLITGLGTVNPLGHNAADTWQAVRDGVCGIGPITRYDCSAQKVHLAAEVKRSKHPAPRHGQSKAGAPNKRARIWSFSAP